MRKIIFILVVVMVFAFLLSPGEAFSQEQYTIKEMTPAVQSALEQRRDRYEQVKALKQDGNVGENNRGYLKAFTEDEAVVAIVEKENADRKVIYTTIAQQNGIEEALETVEKVFAKTQRDNAEIGEKIQAEEGSWIVK